MKANVAGPLLSLVVPIDSIQPDPRNVRRHPGPNLEAIRRSLEAYGQRKPIVVNQRTGHIEAGNGLWQVAKELGWTEIAAVMVDDDGVTAAAFGLMDNRSAELAEWDMPGLKDLLQELDTGAFPIELTGFDEEAMEELMTQFHVPEVGLTDDDAIPEQSPSICRIGDLWQLGNHRLLCGDATKREDVKRLMREEKASLCLTDPPYGLGHSKSFNKAHPDYEDAQPFDLRQLDLSFPFVIWGGNYYEHLPEARNRIGWMVWDKRPDLEGEQRERADRRFGQHFEIAITTVGELRGKMLRHRWGGYYGGEKILHKTQKPIALMLDCILPTEGNILDPFGGSGTTLIACEKLGRRCYMMEIEPHYCDVIIARWQAFTGKQAVKL